MSGHSAYEAELALLGAAFHSPAVAATTTMRPSDFYSPLHEQLWGALVDLHGLGITPDVPTVLGHLNPPPHIAAPLTALMLEVVSYQSIASNAPIYAAQIGEMAERRRLIGVLTSIRQRLEQDEVTLEEALQQVPELVANASRMEEVAEGLRDVDELIDAPDGPGADWVIPGLLTRNDRLVLTGAEGAGKAILIRQMGMCAAAGVDPFTLVRIPPRRVLLIDFENPERVVKETLRRLRGVLRARGVSTGDGTDRRMWVRLFPEGVDLASSEDYQNLEYLIGLSNPDLLLIGPAYKMYVGGSNASDEDLARTVVSKLDRLRTKYGFALVLEHHSPHGTSGERTVRPFGSSLWLRWPEFGFGIRPEGDSEIFERRMLVKHWRGARDERRWPERLHGGGEGELMWVDPDRMAYWKMPNTGPAVPDMIPFKD